MVSKHSWKYRRTFMFAVAGFCMGVITLVLWKGMDTSPAEVAVTMSFTTLIGIVSSYVFGAIWDDKNKE